MPIFLNAIIALKRSEYISVQWLTLGTALLTIIMSFKRKTNSIGFVGKSRRKEREREREEFREKMQTHPLHGTGNLGQQCRAWTNCRDSITH
jgi:hypothetical protein